MERGIGKKAGSFIDFVLMQPLLQKAYTFAQQKHEGQKRFEGISYFTHPVAVARIIYEEWGITNIEILAAALLHDTKEDTSTTCEEIEELFGKKIRTYVDGVTKFSSEESKDADWETIKKVLETNLFDPGSSLIKLGDRLHNMRTMKFIPREKQVPKALETKNIYSPLAESLGLWVVKTELEDLAFKYLDPTTFGEFEKLIAKDPRMDGEYRRKVREELEAILRKHKIAGSVSERINSLARLKAKTDRENIGDIDDVVSFRVVVDDLNTPEETLSEVYRAFGLIRSRFAAEEDEERLDDFYARPRENKYSAIQMTLAKPEGAIEIAVTSRVREDFNNWGIVSLIKRGETDLKKYTLKLVITPRGPAKFLPPQATGVDLAYLVNPAFGLQETGIMINGELRDITDVVPNGSVAEILLGEKRSRPDPRLIKYATLGRTKKEIEKQNREAARIEAENEGKRLVGEILEKRGIEDFDALPNTKRFLYFIGCKSPEDLYYQIASGSLKTAYFEKLLDEGLIG